MLEIIASLFLLLAATLLVLALSSRHTRVHEVRQQNEKMSRLPDRENERALKWAKKFLPHERLKIFGAVVALVIALVAALLPLTVHYQTHEGEHVGYVTATECGGIFFRTCEVYVKTDLESTQEDVYCVSDDDLLEDLREAASLKQRLRLSFTSHVFWSVGCPFSVSHTIQGAEPAGGS